MPELFGFDCYAPREVAERVENIGVSKTQLPRLSQFVLGVLAGGFIGLGAMFSTIVMADAALSFAHARVLGGVAFSLGLILVVLAGAELFTGNNLLIMARISGRITTGRMLENLALVLLGNAVGAVGLALLVAWSGHGNLGNGAVGETVVKIAATKCALTWSAAFSRGVLCNVLVCLAVWVAMAGRSVTDKILAIVPPIAAFVAAGFEHSVANLYFLPLGALINGAHGNLADITWAGALENLIAVTLGNVVGGAGMVGLVYWVIYRRPASLTPPR